MMKEEENLSKMAEKQKGDIEILFESLISGKPEANEPKTGKILNGVDKKIIENYKI